MWAKPCEIVADKDRNILKEIYRWTNGDNWINSENWLTDAPLNEWHGVTADTADVVSGLELADNGLFRPSALTGRPHDNALHHRRSGVYPR
ncbi:MAG: hypothetical protein OXQ93_17230 [Gemmatimonadota bacterium]|nr:hypothetical protein [Gemmatimonadota bacterium]